MRIKAKIRSIQDGKIRIPNPDEVIGIAFDPDEVIEFPPKRRHTVSGRIRSGTRGKPTILEVTD